MSLDLSEEPASYLDTLNPEQRAAVLHGDGDSAAPPLLIIAGAGTGKTNTLAHRVAHFIVCGADPGRILLLTFSRRAAEEMTRRGRRIVARALAQQGESAVELPWAGTFHSVGARLLRDYAPVIGLAPGFTIHDREDSADLMNLVRHELGLSAKVKRFPSRGRVWPSIRRPSTPGENWASFSRLPSPGAATGRPT